MRQIEIGLASFLSVLFGLTIVAFGIALLVSRQFPKWLGWLGLVGGLGNSRGRHRAGLHRLLGASHGGQYVCKFRTASVGDRRERVPVAGWLAGWKAGTAQSNSG